MVLEQVGLELIQTTVAELEALVETEAQWVLVVVMEMLVVLEEQALEVTVNVVVVDLQADQEVLVEQQVNLLMELVI